MKLSQVAAQLYTVREHLKTPADIAVSLKKVRDIGYPAVQVSGMGPISETELVKIIRDEGLAFCATHEPGPQILANPRAVAERLDKLGCRYTAYPYPDGIDLTDLRQVEALAKKLDAAGAVLRAAGKTLAYHNHAIEFLRHGDKTGLELIYERSSPANLKGEPDTYWVQYGGGNPVDWIRRLHGRLPLLHAKDYAFTRENKPVFAEIGSGNLDWKAIVAEADAAGMEWFIVEQDVCPGDPFDSLRKSFDYIKTHLVK